MPYGLLGALALMWTIEGAISRRPLECSDEISNVWRLSGQAARGIAAKAEILCFGDSLTKVGIVPRVLERRLSVPVFNLAVYAGHTSSSYFLLRRALASGARPKAIVLDCHSNLLAAASKTNGRFWTEITNFPEALDLCWQTLDPALSLKMAGAWLLPSHKGRMEIRETLLGTLRGEITRSLRSRQALARNWSMNRGAVLLARNQGPANAFVPGPNLPGQWVPRGVNVCYLERFLNLAALHDVPVFWLLPPGRPDWQASREARGFEAAFTRFVRSMERRHQNLVVVDGRNSGYEASLFFDSTHLNCEGAQALSAGLAEVMSRHRSLASPATRWVPLPAYQPRPADPQVEDFDQSLLALSRRDGSRF